MFKQQLGWNSIIISLLPLIPFIIGVIRYKYLDTFLRFFVWISGFAFLFALFGFFKKSPVFNLFYNNLIDYIEALILIVAWQYCFQLQQHKKLIILYSFFFVFVAIIDIYAFGINSFRVSLNYLYVQVIDLIVLIHFLIEYLVQKQKSKTYNFFIGILSFKILNHSLTMIYAAMLFVTFPRYEHAAINMIRKIIAPSEYLVQFLLIIVLIWAPKKEYFLKSF
jgi:hypothetical protein